jgi:hypothetical protein
MAKFRDSGGRDWEINLTILTMKKLREDSDIRLTDPEQLASIFDDPVKQLDVLWAVCQKQAESYDMSPEDFAVVMTKEYTSFIECLVKGLEDFFRLCGSPELAAIIEKTLHVSKQKQQAVEKNLSSPKLKEVTDNELAAITQKFDHRMDEELARQEKEREQMTTNSSGDSPES